jgi:hypothetical protein
MISPKLLITSAIFLLICACGRHSRSTKTNSETEILRGKARSHEVSKFDLVEALQGYWLRDCTDPPGNLIVDSAKSATYGWKFSGRNATQILTVYKDTDCRELSYEHLVTFEIRDSHEAPYLRKEVSYEIDFTVLTLRYFLSDEETALAFNSKKHEGYTDWQADQAREIRCNKPLYNILSVGENEILIGSLRSSENSGRSEELRPTSLYPKPFIRQ